MGRIGGLIDRLSKNTEIFRNSVTKNELGGNIKTMKLSGMIKMYITSTENSGSRTNIVDEYAATRNYVGQTTAINPDIQINDILKQDGLAYRVDEIDPNAANVAIEAEYKLVRISDLQDKQL